MTKPKPRPARAVDAVRAALDREAAKRPGGLKPVEVVRTALGAYQAYHFVRTAEKTARNAESTDRAGFRRGTQAATERALFNVNYWLFAYEDRIADALHQRPETQGCLKAIAAWNTHTMRLNTLTADDVIALFERFCPPFSTNNRRGDAAREGRGKGPVHDFEQYVREISPALAEDEARALDRIVADIRSEAHVYERYGRATPLDAFYDLLPAWCLQGKLPLLNSTWWNDADVMALVAERLHARFCELGFAESLCSYFLDSMKESIDDYTRTVASEESPYRETPLPQLVELVRAARASHPNSEVEGYGEALPPWLSGMEQLVWNTVVCAVYGPGHARPLLADDLASLPVEGHAPSTDVITELARRAYDAYLDQRRESGIAPEFDSFDAQTAVLRNSGLERIESIPNMMATLGYRIVPAASCYPEQRITAFSPSEVEVLAILEHRRWLVERTRAGWQHAPVKDVEAKRSPYLVSWEDLPDRAREWNRRTARDIPALMGSVGLAISR